VHGEVHAGQRRLAVVMVIPPREEDLFERRGGFLGVRPILRGDGCD